MSVAIGLSIRLSCRTRRRQLPHSEAAYEPRAAARSAPAVATVAAAAASTLLVAFATAAHSEIHRLAGRQVPRNASEKGPARNRPHHCSCCAHRLAGRQVPRGASEKGPARDRPHCCSYVAVNADAKQRDRCRGIPASAQPEEALKADNLLHAAKCGKMSAATGCEPLASVAAAADEAETIIEKNMYAPCAPAR